ncbi:hypothetical protein JW962_02260 [Candidatus Dojkabacteria bacterium]|nr:hypothetical protein [Candidatus Dojkabacteria bacterium]
MHMQSVGEILNENKFKKTFEDLSKPDFKEVSKLPFLKLPLLIENLIFFDTEITKRQIKILLFIMRFSFGCKKATAYLKLTDFYKIGFYSGDITKELTRLIEKQDIGWDKANEEMWINRRLLGKLLAKDEEFASEILRRNLVNHFPKKKYSTSKDTQLTTDTKAKSDSYRYKQINIDSSNRYQFSDVDNHD